jgi:hypothetical protein
VGRRNLRSRVPRTVTSVLVTSANRANGYGYGVIFGFSAGGSLIGPPSQDRRITDPGGISCDQSVGLVYVKPLATTAAGTQVRITPARVEPVESGI